MRAPALTYGRGAPGASRSSANQPRRKAREQVARGAPASSLTKHLREHRVPLATCAGTSMLNRRAVLAGLAVVGFPIAARTQGFPSRTITIVVPYPPGGPIDALARLIAQEGAGDLKIGRASCRERG